MFKWEIAIVVLITVIFIMTLTIVIGSIVTAEVIHKIVSVFVLTRMVIEVCKELWHL